MSKFKVGTKVRDIAPGFEDKRGVVVSEDVPGVSLVKWKDGKIVRELDRCLVVDNSAVVANPVVQNALAARNAKFKLGDVVTDEYGDKAVVLNPDAGNGTVKIKYVKDQKLVIVAPEEIKKAKNSAIAANASVPFTRHDIYDNLNTAQNRIVNAINLASHLVEPFKSKLAPGIAKVKRLNDQLSSVVAELENAYKAAEAEAVD